MDYQTDRRELEDDMVYRIALALLGALLLVCLTGSKSYGNDQEVFDRLEQVTNQTNARLDRMQKDSEDVLTSLRQLNAQVAALRGDVSSLTTQVTGLDYRLTALERGSVQPYRAAGRLTDPLAARVAGRTATVYDGYGQEYAPMQPVVSGAYQPTAASRIQFVQAQPVQFVQQPLQFASFQSSYAAFASASSGSCGAGGCSSGRGLFGRRGRR